MSQSEPIEPTEQQQKGHLPRLRREHYQGFAFVHWIFNTIDRETRWLTPSLHAAFREFAVHAASRYHFALPVYCLMPDHVHMVGVGLHEDADQFLAIGFLRKHLQRVLEPTRLQKQPYDHVLREKERERGAFQAAAYYVLENPVRKKLVTDRTAYPFSGCIVAGYPELDVHADDYWTRFWRVYAYVRRGRSNT